MAKAQEPKPEMLTAGKLSEKLGFSPAKIKKAIEELQIEPDMKKGPCSYYSEASATKIKNHLS